MPVCKNCPLPSGKKCYYTGKENTPRGHGYAARYEKEGKRMKGTDGKMYYVKGDRWVLVKSKKRVVSPRIYGLGKEGNLAKLRENEMLKMRDVRDRGLDPFKGRFGDLDIGVYDDIPLKIYKERHPEKEVITIDTPGTYPQWFLDENQIREFNERVLIDDEDPLDVARSYGILGSVYGKELTQKEMEEFNDPRYDVFNHLSSYEKAKLISEKDSLEGHLEYARKYPGGSTNDIWHRYPPGDRYQSNSDSEDNWYSWV